MDIFFTGFFVLMAGCLLLFIFTRQATPITLPPDFQKFQRSYLAVYLLAMGGDWLQGPHVYALYQSYGLSSKSIQILFVVGFGASMLVGTIVGSFADKYGRRANCILYGILYSLACITKHFSNFWVLMVGRLLAGIATSILYSAFESWLIYEHNHRKFDSHLLSHIFSVAVFWNSVVAIVAGLLSQWAADHFGFVAPFDLSLAVLCAMCVLIYFTWTENYMDSSTAFTETAMSAYRTIKSDPVVLCLGLVQSLFEGAMYMFVLEWTPALTPVNSDISGSKVKGDHRGAVPHGIIFAAFMVAIVIGSFVFKILIRHSTPESFMRYILAISAAALFVPVIFSKSDVLIFTGFLVFECCVGVFWPSLSTMRGKYVPEKTRATIMNFSRIPLNLIVVIMLLQSLSVTVIFLCCAVFLTLAAICQQVLYSLSLKKFQLPSDIKDLSVGKQTMLEEKGKKCAISNVIVGKIHIISREIHQDEGKKWEQNGKVLVRKSLQVRDSNLRPSKSGTRTYDSQSPGLEPTTLKVRDSNLRLSKSGTQTYDSQSQALNRQQ